MHAGALALCAIAAAALAGTARAAAPGSLDTGFNRSGVVAPIDAQLLGVAVQDNGEAVAVGQSRGSVFVERLTAVGTPDGTYTGPSGVARAVAVESDGDIVVTGSSGGAMLVERLLPGLTPDPSFGSGGVATAFGGASGVANAVALGPDGTIVAAGSVGNARSTTAVAEFSANGSASTQTFGFGGNSIASGVALEPSGNIVVVGRRNPSQVVDAVIAVLSSGGSLDSAATYDYPSAGSTAFGAVTLLTDGQIVVGGQANAGSGPQALFLRYDSNGSLDSSFGSGGVTAVPASESLNINPGGSVGAYGIGLTGPSGEIVGAGPFENGGTEVDAAAWAVTPDGAAATDFGNTGAGTELGPTSSGPSGNYEACALAIAPDGSPDAGEIVTAGDTPGVPDESPCTTGGSSNGFVAQYVGYGPPPAPTPPSPTPPGPTPPGPTPPGPTRPTPPAPPVPAAAPATPLKLTVSGVKRNYKTANVVKQGLSVTAGCSQGCTLRMALIVSAATARRLHIRTIVNQCMKVHGRHECKRVKVYRSLTLSPEAGTLATSASRTFVLHVGGAFAKALRTRKSAGLTIEVTAFSTATQTSQVVKKPINFNG